MSKEMIEISSNLIISIIRSMEQLLVVIQPKPHSATLFVVYVMHITTWTELASRTHGITLVFMSARQATTSSFSVNQNWRL